MTKSKITFLILLIAILALAIPAITLIAQGPEPGGGGSGSGGAGTTYTGSAPIDITGTVVSCPTCSVAAPGWTLLATCTASTAAECLFVSVITSTYDDYVVKFNLVFSNDQVGGSLHTSTDNGATYDTGSANYHWIATRQTPNGTVVGSGTTDTKLDLTGGDQTIDNDATGVATRFRGEFTLVHPLDATANAFVKGWSSYYTSASGLIKADFQGWRLSAADVNAIRITPSAGTFTGTIRLYGVAK